MKRFAFAMLSLLAIVSFIVSGCAEKVTTVEVKVIETQIVEKEKIVQQTVEVEKVVKETSIVEKVVKETSIVEKVVEVTPTAAPVEIFP